MKKIRYLDMFAGVGGFRSGLTNAGDFFVPVGWCEIDPFAQKPTELYTKRKVNIFVTMQPESNAKNSPNLILSQPDSLVSRFQYPVEDSALLIQEALSFMKSSEWLKPGELLIFCLKTSKGYSITKGGKLSEPSLPRFMSWGILLNGVCLTARISASRNSDGGYTLSDILIADCPGKYFLSPRAVERLLSKLYPEDKGKESTPRKEQAHV